MGNVHVLAELHLNSDRISYYVFIDSLPKMKQRIGQYLANIFISTLSIKLCTL